MPLKLNVDLDIKEADAKIRKLESEWERSTQKVERQKQKIEELKKELDEYNKILVKSKKLGDISKDPWVKELRQRLSEANSELKKLQANAELAGIKFYKLKIPKDTNNNLNNISNSFRNISNSFRNILPNSINVFKSALSGIGDIFKNLISRMTTFISRIGKLATYTFIFNVINSSFRDMREYMSYLISANNDLSSGLAQVRGNLLTAFQPIWETILPYLIQFTQWLAQATAYVSSFINALLGKSEQQSRATAKNIQNQIALSNKSTKELNKQKKSTDELNDSEKKRRKELAKFDELNIIKGEKSNKTSSPTSSQKGTTPISQGGIATTGISFETSKIDTSGIQALVKKIKNYFLPLQEPFDKLMRSLDRLKGYTFEAFRDFYNIFLKPLADFTINEILPHLMNSLADALDRMDFEKVNAGLKELWKALEPLAEDALKGATWILDNLLLPLSEWTVNKIVPRFLEALKNILEIIRPVAETAGEQLIKLWDEFLKPIAEWTGGVITEKLDELNDVLKKIGDWAKDPKNRIALEWISSFIIGALAAALGAVLLPLLWKLVTATVAWTAALLANPITWVVILVGALVGALIMLVTHFDDVKKVAEDAWNTFKYGIKSVWEYMQKIPMFKYISDVIEDIKGVFNGLIDFFAGGFTNDCDRVFKGVYNIFAGIINSIIDGINFVLNGVKLAVSGVLSMINNSGILGNILPKFNLPDMNKPTIGKIPYLATGAVIPPNSPFLAMLGDQRSGTNIEAPLETIKQAFKEALRENNMYGNNGNYTFVAQLDGRTIFEETVHQNDMYINQVGRSAFA